LCAWRSGFPDRHAHNPGSLGNGTRFVLYVRATDAASASSRGRAVGSTGPAAFPAKHRVPAKATYASRTGGGTPAQLEDNVEDYPIVVI
jgi:hypothetical protein